MTKANNEVDLDKMPAEEEDLADVVVMTDDKGNETYFYEEMVFPVGRENFAVLVQFDPEAEEAPEEEEENVVIAKVQFDADGEPEYVDPTEEEFEAARAAYEKLMDELEAEE